TLSSLWTATALEPHPLSSSPSALLHWSHGHSEPRFGFLLSNKTARKNETLFSKLALHPSRCRPCPVPRCDRPTRSSCSARSSPRTTRRPMQPKRTSARSQARLGVVSPTQSVLCGRSAPQSSSGRGCGRRRSVHWKRAPSLSRGREGTTILASTRPLCSGWTI
ncbi:unnamed protein product, partial [Mycena citricolor]